MPQYKLIYFNLRARGEVIRLLFEVAGVPYEDFRVDFSRWPDLKKGTNQVSDTTSQVSYYSSHDQAKLFQSYDTSYLTHTSNCRLNMCIHQKVFYILGPASCFGIRVFRPISYEANILNWSYINIRFISFTKYVEFYAPQSKDRLLDYYTHKHQYFMLCIIFSNSLK